MILRSNEYIVLLLILTAWGFIVTYHVLQYRAYNGLQSPVQLRLLMVAKDTSMKVLLIVSVLYTFATNEILSNVLDVILLIACATSIGLNLTSIRWRMFVKDVEEEMRTAGVTKQA